MGKFARKACALIISATLLAPIGAKAGERCNALRKTYKPLIEERLGKWNPTIISDVRFKISGEKKKEIILFVPSENTVYIDPKNKKEDMKKQIDFIDHEMGHCIYETLEKSKEGRKLLKKIIRAVVRDEKTLKTRRWIKIIYYYAGLIEYFKQKTGKENEKIKEESKNFEEIINKIYDAGIKNLSNREMKRFMEIAKKIIYSAGKGIEKEIRENGNYFSVNWYKTHFEKKEFQTELFARVVDSLMDGYHGKENGDEFELNDGVLELLKEIKINGIYIFQKEVEYYRSGESIPVEPYVLKELECVEENGGVLKTNQNE
ncbi:hypothetical protein KAW38_04045 [Candidatus Micrarchaeota archaeon]|nr:hypothetical protein [Candidatus Micrarchaeota archaeon]